jgi:transketolase
VPDSVYKHFKAGIGERGDEVNTKWNGMLAPYRSQNPALALEFGRMQKRNCQRREKFAF